MGEHDGEKHSRIVASSDVLRGIVEEVAANARLAGESTFGIAAVQAALDARGLVLPSARRPAGELRNFVSGMYNIDQLANGQGGGYPFSVTDKVTEPQAGSPDLGLPEDLAALGYASPQTVKPGKPASTLVQKHRFTDSEAIGPSKVTKK